MRKSFLFVIIILSVLSVNAQSENTEDSTLVSVVKVNFEGLKGVEYKKWVSFYGEGTDATIEAVDDGIAVTNPRMQEQIWQPQLNILEDFSLESGHDYIVRLKLKVPSDGTYQLCMGDRSVNFARQVAVRKQDGFQIIDVEYPEYGAKIVNAARILLGCGWVVGTTIIQEVEVFERLGYWNNQGFFELTPDESIVYKFVLAMDEKSQDILNGLYASMKETRDKSLIKCNETGAGGWYVKKDYPLPEGNYFESAFYNSNSQAHANELYVILPQVQSFMNNCGWIEDLLEYLGDKVTVDLIKEQEIEGYKSTDFRFICNLKTSEEWLKLCLDVYNYGFEGLHNFVPSHFIIDRDYNSHLIGVISDANENDENLVYSMNWEGVKYPVTDLSPDDPWKTTDEGLAIVNPEMQEYPGQVWTIINAGGFSLEENHDYIVRLTMKVPSDGTYMVNLGNWSIYYSKEVSVSAGDDFQVIDIPFPDFWGDITDRAFEPIEEDAHITLSSGWVVGTTVVKNVQVFENRKSGTTAVKHVTTTTPDDVIYNLSGQRVSPSYKGIVIQNGRKVVK